MHLDVSSMDELRLFTQGIAAREGGEMIAIVLGNHLFRMFIH